MQSQYKNGYKKFELVEKCKAKLIVINEIRLILRKNWNFPKFRKLQEVIWLTVINEIFKFPPHLDPYLFELSSDYLNYKIKK